MDQYFSKREDAKAPKQLFDGSAAKGKSISGGSKSGKHYKQESEFGNSKKK